MLGARPCSKQARVFDGAVEDADRPDATFAQMLHRHGCHVPCAHHDDLAIGQAAELGLREVGPQRHERVGGGAHGRLLSHASPSPRCGVEQTLQRRVGGIF